MPNDSQYPFGTTEDLGKVIQAKYPQYGKLSPRAVAGLVLQKYPQYKGQVKELATAKPMPQHTAGQFVAPTIGNLGLGMAKSAASTIPGIGMIPQMQALPRNVRQAFTPQGMGQWAGSLAMDVFMGAAGGANKAKTAKSAMEGLGEIIKGVNPRPKIARFVENMKEALPLMRQTAAKDGMQVASKEDLLKVAQRTAQMHYERYESLLKPVENETVSTSGAIRGYRGGEVNQAHDATLRQLDSRLNELNDSLSGKYEKGAKAIGAQEAHDMRVEAAGIRKTLYGAIKKRTGVDPGPIKQTMGKLNAVAEEIGYSHRARQYELSKPLDQSLPKSATEGAVRAANKVYRTVGGDPQDRLIRKGFNRF